MLDHEKLEQYYAFYKLLEKKNVLDEKYYISDKIIWIQKPY